MKNKSENPTMFPFQFLFAPVAAMQALVPPAPTRRVTERHKDKSEEAPPAFPFTPPFLKAFIPPIVNSVNSVPSALIAPFQLASVIPEAKTPGEFVAANGVTMMAAGFTVMAACLEVTDSWLRLYGLKPQPDNDDDDSE